MSNLKYNPTPASLRDVLVNTLADIGMLPEFKRMSREKLDELKMVFGLSSEDTTFLVYDAQERIRTRKRYANEQEESAAYVRQLWRQDVEALRKKYDTFMFWVVFIGMIVGGVFLALCCPHCLDS